MKSWQAAADKIRRRNINEVIESIEVETPFGFDPAFDASDVPDFLEASWEVIGGGHEAVITLPGRDMNFARDLLISIKKFCHVLECATHARNRGALTWALVDAYHAALLGSRVVAALYGALSYTVNGRTVLVDFRPNLGSVDEVKRFQRDFKGVAEPVLILRPQKALLEQKDSWALISRLSSIGRIGQTGVELEFCSLLEDLAKSSLGAIRNLILYDSVYWTWRYDFGAGPFDERALSAEFVSDDESVRRLLDSLKALVSSVRRYVAQLLAHLGIEEGAFPELANDVPAITQVVHSGANEV
ncbi:MAG: hypothetical protein E5X33_15425 [Mesorhizobium sp.]|uniref:hypothetical protein n=1 Tax=Mesorhizobium sp. TaxID=1871066 RepID=UPI001205D2B3|nr:hypothetical protein [Mesorhizobium sp.]TIR20896.1 MAG: hypothetical protein E5X33_15425 [Mesorhizobium sp.]